MWYISRILDDKTGCNLQWCHISYLSSSTVVFFKNETDEVAVRFPDSKFIDAHGMIFYLKKNYEIDIVSGIVHNGYYIHCISEDELNLLSYLTWDNYIYDTAIDIFSYGHFSELPNSEHRLFKFVNDCNATLIEILLFYIDEYIIKDDLFMLKLDEDTSKYSSYKISDVDVFRNLLLECRHARYSSMVSIGLDFEVRNA